MGEPEETEEIPANSTPTTLEPKTSVIRVWR
jgi:hypothetical protein